ncbi:unnamed protein product [Schistosoma turkestanicum]|nr:unnamed protein product [Schistosoma turkestanicum]
MPVDHGGVGVAPKAPCDRTVPRDTLLEYLVNCSDSWFQNLGICSVCSVRLCRWAGTLGPKFPATTTDIRLGTSVAQQAAAVVASTTSSNMSSHVQHLLDLTNPNNRSEVYERLCRDANPAAVAIIEDMPVHEFLRSRGNYCQSPRIAISNNGVCCGGHACDLVITHRELMRHSLCRPCLSSFWSWASKHVAWWRWSFSTIDEQFPNSASSGSSKTGSIQTTLSFGKRNNSERSSDIEPPVGICIQCQAKMSLQLQSPPSMSVTSSQSPILSHGAGSEPKGSDTLSVNENPSKSLRLIPLAALDLLRSRLSNAHEVTPVTYVATDLINDFVFSQYIKKLLVSSNDSDLISHNLLDSSISLPYNQMEQMAVCASSSSKRRKMDNLQNEILSHHSGSQSSNSTSISRPLLMDSDPMYKPPESNSSNTFLTCKYRLPQEASDLGEYTRDNPDTNWNYPRPVTVHYTRSVIPWISSSLFSYVQTGASLLKSPRQPTDSLSELTVVDQNLGLPASHETTANGTHVDSYETDPCEGSNRSSMTACCRCGRIVLQTFPVDPHSNISAVVCEKLVYSENRHLTPSSQKTHDSIVHPQCSSNLDAHTPTSHPSYQPDLSLLNPCPSGSISLSNRSRNVQTRKSEPTERSVNGVLHLIEQTGNNSVLNAVNRSITEVITGLFVDMGEYGSASSLQDVTHRICRWELSLCSPIYNTSHLSSPSDERDSTRSACLPMPTNVAVSYNNNSLVVPHARLFNDSSVCLSADGRLLAAFVIPRETSSQSSALLGTLLAVYRLQPQHSRGQCLFARRFTASSPVCVDFSPLGDFLAVGLATTRIPSEPLSTTRESSAQGLLRYGSSSSLQDHVDLRQPNAKCSCQRQSPVACVFHLQRSKTHKGRVRRSLCDIQNIKHPSLLDPISSKYLEFSNPSTEKLDRWHRLLLSAQSGISLNTIVWNANGSILYGTTKGLIVISHGNQSSSVSILPLRCTKSHVQSVNECEVSYGRKFYVNQAQTITSSSTISVSQSHAVI